MNLVLSEVDKELKHAFLTAQRLTYTGDREPELGKFVVAYYLETIQNKDGSRKETDRARRLLRSKLSEMNVLLLGENVNCDYRDAFGNVDSIDNFFHLNDFMRFFVEEVPKIGEYDLIITENYAKWIPSGVALSEYISKYASEKYKVEKKDWTEMTEWDWHKTEQSRDHYRHAKENLATMIWILSKIKDEATYELPTEFTEGEILPFKEQFEDPKVLLGLEKCNSHNYGAEIIMNTLKKGGIFIDRKMDPRYKMSKPFFATIMEFRTQVKSQEETENVYENLVLLDKEYGVFRKDLNRE